MFGERMALGGPQLVANGIVRHLQLVEQLIKASENISLPKVTDGMGSFKRLVDTFA